MGGPQPGVGQLSRALPSPHFDLPLFLFLGFHKGRGVEAGGTTT